MKPWPAALLVTGAALASAIAVRMSEPPPLPQADWRSAPVFAPPEQTAQPAAPVLAAASPGASGRAQPATAPPPIYEAPEQASSRRSKAIRADQPAPRSLPVKPFPAAVFVREGTAGSALTRSSAVNGTIAATVQSADDQRHRRRVTLTPGETIAVSVDGRLPGCALPNETFMGWLSEPVVADHLIIAERGARVAGRCSAQAWRMQPQIRLVLSRFMTTDGQWVAITTAVWSPGANGVSPARFQIAEPVTITERTLEQSAANFADTGVR